MKEKWKIDLGTNFKANKSYNSCLKVKECNPTVHYSAALAHEDFFIEDVE